MKMDQRFVDERIRKLEAGAGVIQAIKINQNLPIPGTILGT